MELSELGYDDYRRWAESRPGFKSGSVARVIAEHRELYRVLNGSGERTARITGAMRSEAVSREDYPAVGDWVAISEIDSEKATINSVLPRRTVLRRKAADGANAQIIASNIDTAFIVQAVGRDFSINRLERAAALVAAGGIRTVVLLNKTDTASREETDTMIAGVRARMPDTDVLGMSAETQSGIDLLRPLLEAGKTYCFIGSSGVGKSTIINRLLGRDSQKTGAISESADRGTHVTTVRELIVLGSGAMVIDNPGMREMGVLGAEGGIGDAFSDIIELARSCKFGDCSHTTEPGCAVRDGIDAGTLDEMRLTSYDKLRRENAFHDMTALERRRKDKNFGKFIKKLQSNDAKSGT